MAKMIDPKQSRVKIWIVQSLRDNGNWSINAICLNRLRAVTYRKTLLNQYGIVKAWIEQSEANHLYGEMFKLGDVIKIPAKED